LVTYHAALPAVKTRKVIKAMKNKRFMKEGVDVKQQMHNAPPSISVVKEKRKCYKIFNSQGDLIADFVIGRFCDFLYGWVSLKSPNPAIAKSKNKNTGTYAPVSTILSSAIFQK
jgi:hypothetical protein